jgi:transposase
MPDLGEHGEETPAPPSFTPEFTAEILDLCQCRDRPVGQVAKDLDLAETAAREWMKRAERDTGTRSDGGLASTERQDLSQLRREDRRHPGLQHS